MTTEVTVPLEKKLKNLRGVLWMCFAGISVSVTLMMVIANAFLVRSNPDITSMGRDAVIPMILLGVGILFTVATIGTVCLVIYYVVKRRLERDNDIFL